MGLQVQPRSVSNAWQELKKRSSAPTTASLGVSASVSGGGGGRGGAAGVGIRTCPRVNAPWTRTQPQPQQQPLQHQPSQQPAEGQQEEGAQNRETRARGRSSMEQERLAARAESRRQQELAQQERDHKEKEHDRAKAKAEQFGQIPFVQWLVSSSREMLVLPRMSSHGMMAALPPPPLSTEARCHLRPFQPTDGDLTRGVKRMVQTGCLVPLNETCSPQIILIQPLCYCPIASNSVGQGPIELDMVF